MRERIDCGLSKGFFSCQIGGCRLRVTYCRYLPNCLTPVTGNRSSPSQNEKATPAELLDQYQKNDHLHYIHRFSEIGANTRKGQPEKLAIENQQRDHDR